MILSAFEKAYKRKEEKNWFKIFIFCDIHETILYPDYSNTKPLKFYYYAKETLQLLSTLKDVELGLYTCSHPEEIENYQKFFKENDINFIYVNKNPDVSDSRYGYYQDKPYFNILLEDKSGFDAETDWLPIYEWINKKYNLK